MVSITALELGRRSVKRKFLELCQDVNGEEMIDISHWVFLCQTGKHNVLIDSGPYNQELLKVNGRGEYKYYHDLIPMLGDYLNPTSIDLVVLTHLHWDHCANSSFFDNAKIVVQKDEVAYANSHIPIHSRFYDIDSLSFLNSHRNILIINGNMKIDDTLKILKTPGHTPGSQSVLVSYNKTRIAFQGDNYTLATGLPPGISSSMVDWWTSHERIRHLSDISIPTHDPLAEEILKKAME
ncbi:MAG: MBL fold metallo-hydrolase [Candidatus Micrarchaeaceae archaeon]